MNRPLAALFLLSTACTARHLVVPEHVSAKNPADYGAASLQIRSFLVTGLGSNDDAATGPAALRSAFAEYVTSKCRFRDVRFGKETPDGTSIAVDVNVTAEHTAQRTYVLDLVGIHPAWPLVPQWGAARVKVAISAEDGASRWTTEGSADSDYSMIFWAWWRTTPVEDAYRQAYGAAFQKAAGAFCSDVHTAHASSAPARSGAMAASVAAGPAVAAPAVVSAPASVRPASAVTGSGKVAVLDFRNFTRDLQRENVQYFTDLVRGVVLKSAPRFNVITRENLLVLLQASGKDAAACEGECEVDTGRRIGADLIVSGEIQKVGTRFKISLRMHETNEGRLISTAIASGASVDALDDAATKAADELVAPIR